MGRMVVLVAALLAALGVANAQEPQTKGTVAGVYLCEGKNPDGSPYKGIVEIAAVRDTYLVRWSLADGVEVFGVGIMRENSLSVSYFGGTPAIVVYKTDGDRLVGEWTQGGTEGTVFGETLTKMPDHPGVPRQPRAPARPRPTTSQPGTIRL